MLEKIYERVVLFFAILKLTCVWLPKEIFILFLGRYVSKSIDNQIYSCLGTFLKDYDLSAYKGSCYSLQYLIISYRVQYLDLMKSAKLGEKAPNPQIVCLDDGQAAHLLDFQKKGRPLVLNFGSCSCPFFIGEFTTKFKTVVDEFCDKADFVMIYTEEAHPTDGWHFVGNRFQIANHRSQEERLKAASQLLTLEPHCNVVVDTMTNDANKKYGGLYERAYILLDGIIVYAGGKSPEGYKLEEVGEWLRNHFKS